MEIKIIFLENNTVQKVPLYATEGSAGFDLYSVDDIIIPPKEVSIIRTGISAEIPSGFEMQIRSRSGLAAKSKVFVLNAPGTIDSDYRGEIKICLVNLSNDPFTIKDGERIAQMVIACHETAQFVLVTKLSETERGEGGHGHTGK